MMFTPGEVYRRLNLHEKYGGQRQGGISTPADQSLVLLFTGEQGRKYGYEDGFREDGTFWYTGEGQVGDMEMLRGNLAIRDHAVKGKALHLFEYVTKGQVRYVGEALYLGYHTEPAPDRNGNPRKAIVFELSLGSEVEGAASGLAYAPHPELSALWRESMARLRERSFTKIPKESPPKERRANVYERSEAVRVYVLRRADGHCEGCGEPAPFMRSDGRPYLEPHHIRRRADGGPDHPRWVIALCPNCHRRVHYGADGGAYNEELSAFALEREGAED
jgi:5-methylcytosine-specific restriction protein A